MKTLRLILVSALLAPAASTLAQESKPPLTFEVHGFAGVSLYVQDANLGSGSGHQAYFVNAQTPSVAAPSTDRLVLGADVRQSRFNFSITGPQVLAGATVKSVLELDFYGGASAGNFGPGSPLPRLRQVWGELDWGSHRILAGQVNDLFFAIAPTSLSHIATPVSYAAGSAGFKRPGLFGFHTLGASGPQLELAWEVGRSNWADAADTDRYGFSGGDASAIPAFQARATLKGATWSVFTSGHFSRVDRSGVNASSTETTGADLNVVAGNVGGKVVLGPVTFAATGFTGKNLGPLSAALLQFQPNGAGDVHEYGAWGQVGFHFTKELSLWGFTGFDHLDPAEAVAAQFTRLRNVTTAGLLQYRETAFAVGLEWFHFRTTTRVYAGGTGAVTPEDAEALSGALDGNQGALTVQYYF